MRLDNNFIQMAFYNGWKKHHGIKFQSIELPNGMCMHMFGPKSFRESDLDLLESSDIIDMLKELQAHLPEAERRGAYGDGIYPAADNLYRKHVPNGAIPLTLEK